MNRTIIVRIVAGAAAAIAMVILATWALGIFSRLSHIGAVALIAGTILTMGLGIGLMTLVFWSARSGRDEVAYRVRLIEPSQKAE